jgi:hypothetical protein
MALISIHLSEHEQLLIVRISEANGLLYFRPHRDLSVQRLGAIGLVYAVPFDAECVRLHLSLRAKG